LTRRTSALAAVGVIIALALVALWYSGRTGPDAGGIEIRRTADQNVLVITIDTLRADALSSYGGRAATPHLDALARDGARFAFAHAHAVVTLPSHTSILTGRYPFEHGVRDNSGYRVPDDARTLAEIAKDAGLATGAFVGAFPLDRRFGLDQGFDVYDDVGGLDISETEFTMAERRAGEVVTAARAWIAGETANDRPWFTWVHVFDPHSGYTPPPPFHQQYADDPYAGEVAYVDSALGPLLDAARNSARPTLVIVTSDHGEGLGDHGEATHGTFAYESTLRVPLIVAQVGAGAPTRRQGIVSDRPVSHVDIVPSVVDALGLAKTDGLPGESLLGDLEGASGGRTAPRIYFEAMTPMLTRGWAPLMGVIEGRTKYIDLPIQEVYDLAADPREETNLASRSASATRALENALKAFGATLPGARRDENAEARARLESLGYIGGSAPRRALYTEADDPKRLVELDRLMLEGIEHYSRGRFDEAIAAYRTVVTRRPDMLVAYRRLAYFQWEKGDPAAAIASLREGLDKGGRDIETEVRLATYLVETGAINEGLPMLERAVAASPDDTEALNALGIARARAGRPADALAAFARIIEREPRNVHAHENIGTVHLGGDLAAAAAAFSRALELSPTSSRAQAGLGIVALRQGRRDEAIARWRRAVELDPSNFDAMYNLATELLDAGRVAEARPYIETFVRTAPPAFYGEDIRRLAAVLR